MTKKQKLIIQLIGIVLMLVFLLRPAAAKLIERLQTKRQLEKRLSQLETKFEVLSGIDSILIDNRVRQMEAVFPSEKPIVELMGSLSQLALENGLTFGGITLSPGSLSQEESKTKNKKANPEGLFDLRFGFQVGGDFDKISQFLAALENTSPLMKIESVGMSIKTNPLFEREATLVVAEIEVLAYYQAPPKTLGSVDKPVKLLSKNEELLLNKLVGFRTFPFVIPQAPSGKENLFE
jgi:Tfp pilus assembly protein PilO